MKVSNKAGQLGVKPSISYSASIRKITVNLMIIILFIDCYTISKFFQIFNASYF